MELRPKLAGLALGFGLLFAASPAAALAVYGYDFTGADWFSPDWVGVGSAHWANDGALVPPTRLRLTSAAGGQLGNAWINTGTVDAGQAWSAEFTWQITFEGGGGADGFGFHLHEAGTGANTFFNGAGLGASFLSIAVDTWDNGGEGSYHLEVYNNGPQVGGNIDLNPLGGVADDVYQMLMTYDGAGNLAVNVINTANLNQTGILNYAVNLAALDTAIFGWSGQTGGAVENHDIRTFSGTFVPEPGTGLLVGMGLAGLAWRRRRRA
jgi:hypothetical protein